jgi:probable HAF family extracellular repeat protein
VIGSAQLHNRLATLIGVASLLAVVGGARTAGAQSGPYTYTKIQPPGAIYTEATGINNAGIIVGTYWDAQSVRHGFKYDGTTYTNIEFPGSSHNYGIGIGHAGQILGTHSVLAEGPYHGFILENGVFTSFDYPGMDTDGRGINADGQIAGVYNAGGLTTPHGYVKTGDEYVPIDYPGSWGTEAWGINNNGVVSGNYYDTSAGGIHGFVYSNGTYTSVNFPGASTTRLTRLNNLNQAVGWHSQGARTLGFVLSGNSYRSVSYNDADSTVAVDINDVGQIVGKFTGPDCPMGCGFLATPKAGAPLCDQHINLTYTGNVLTMNFNLAASVPTTWSTFVFVNNTLVPLWSAAIPAIPAPVNIPFSIPNFPHLGYVFGVSLLSTPTGGIVCADFETVNTGI